MRGLFIGQERARRRTRNGRGRARGNGVQRAGRRRVVDAHPAQDRRLPLGDSYDLQAGHARARAGLRRRADAAADRRRAGLGTGGECGHASWHRRLLLRDRKSTRLNSSHGYISYAVFFLQKLKQTILRALVLLRKTSLSKNTSLEFVT